MDQRGLLAARRVALLALLGAGACRSRAIVADSDEGAMRRPGPSEQPAPPQPPSKAPALRPLASLEPAPAGAPVIEVAPACSQARAPRGVARYDWGETGPSYVAPASSAAPPYPWLRLARSDPSGSPRVKLCYTKGQESCASAGSVKATFYADVCCEKLGLGDNARGPWVERVAHPEACAGVQVCCYEGDGEHGSGPGRPLRVGGRTRLAALQSGQRGAWA